jgi:hypothetical protein
LLWPAYTLDQRATMIFAAANSQVTNDPGSAVRLRHQALPQFGLFD